MEYHAVIKNNSCRASFFDCLFPPSGISMLLFLWGTILPPPPIVWVGVQEVPIGQREELSCDAVAIKKPQMTPVGSSSWIHPSMLSHLEAKGLGFSPYTPYVNHWMRADTGRDVTLV